jgi:phosphatidylglycerophosphate synthase
VQVKPTWTGKVATFFFFSAIAWVMLQVRFFPLIYVVAAAGFFTLVSGVIYVTDGFRQLGEHGQSKAS